jgi:hypothetical protein
MPDSSSSKTSAELGMDRMHQCIGEFVVAFQWIENLYRQMGWPILDPEREAPKALRKETNSQLIDKVTDLFVNLTKRYELPGGAEKAEEMEELRISFHELRNYRNRLLHSTYVELKAGGEVQGYLRSNPKMIVDPDSGEVTLDQEFFSSELFEQRMADYAAAAFRLNIIHMQLIHWTPFTAHERKS